MIQKKDETTGEETEVEDYDWEAITKAVKTFAADYNSVIEESGNCSMSGVLKRAVWMTNITEANRNLLSKAGITIGKGNKLEIDEEALKKADINTLKTLFCAPNSYVDKVSQKAGQISIASIFKAGKGGSYTNTGDVSKLVNIGEIYDKSK